MKIDWKRIQDHKIELYVSCLISTVSSSRGIPARNVTVAFKTASGEWMVGTGKFCWFEPIYFAYLREEK